MIARFHSREAAALFVAHRRNDGYFAELCDDSVASLWGAQPIGGVRVITSDEALGDEDEEPVLNLPTGWVTAVLQRCSSIIFGGAVLLTILLMAAMFIKYSGWLMLSALAVTILIPAAIVLAMACERWMIRPLRADPDASRILFFLFPMAVLLAILMAA